MNKYQVEVGEDSPGGHKFVNAFAKTPEDAARGVADSWLSTGVCEEVPIDAVRVYVGEGKAAVLQDEPVTAAHVVTAAPKIEPESETEPSSDSQ